VNVNRSEKTLVAAGLTVGVLALVKCMKALVEEDRPTIRVRSGSIQVDIDYGDFTPDGASVRKWWVNGTGAEDFIVSVTGHAALQGAEVTLHFTKGHEHHDLLVRNVEGLAYIEFLSDDAKKANGHVKKAKRLKAGKHLKLTSFSMNSHTWTIANDAIVEIY